MNYWKCLASERIATSKPPRGIANLKYAWEAFKQEWGGDALFRHEGLIGGAPAAIAAPAAKVVKFEALPGAMGQLDYLVHQRIGKIATALRLDPLAVQKHFPHLYPEAGGSVRFPKSSGDGPLAQYIDHTLLKADAGAAAIEKLCREAVEHKFFGVCVNSGRVELAARLLEGTDVAVCAVAGFPLGAMDPKTKALEAAQAVKNGATEIDMVVNIAKLQEGDHKSVGNEISQLVDAVKASNPKALVKVILETCLLTTEQIVDGSVLCVLAGADFVKTSTGTSKTGATPEALDVMMAVVREQCLIKAAGGVKTPETARQFVRAGINRIGTSSGVALVSGAAAGNGY